MPKLRSHIALLLLLCLGRTLLPEAWLLDLHPHQHTRHEEAHGAAFARRHQGKLLLGAQHRHCTVEQFYDVAYQAGAAVRLPLPAALRCYAPLPAALAAVRVPGRGADSVWLRGPPAGV